MHALPGPGGARLLVVDLAARSHVWQLPPGGERAIKDGAPPGWEVQVVQALTVSDGDGNEAFSDEACSAVAEAEVYVGFGMPRGLFRAARKLRWVHSAAAGVGALLYPEMRESEVILTNSAGVHAVPIAEYVVGGVLHFLRGFDVALGQQRRGVWDKEPFIGAGSRARELGECRALIVGTGGIGGEVATRFAALGARCVGVRRRAGLGAPEGFERVVAFEELDAELPGADVVVLAAPLTPETRGLLTAGRLDRLSGDAIVVNVSRGALMDERALVERLAAGRLRGAVLDVFETEPLPPESPLWGMSHVLLTPHVSGVSPRRFWEREIALLIDNWGRYVRGEPLRNLVDKQAGY